jgi:ADP-ribose pyrophosphatase YjhB (NUDIX family)
LAVRLNKEVIGGVLVPPGGKLEADESVRECIIRELKEELNIDVEINKLEAITEEKYEDGYWVFILYGAKIIKGEPTIMEPDKILELRWVDISEVKNSNSIKWVRD